MRYFHVPPRLHFPNIQFPPSFPPIFIGINRDDRGREQLRLDSKKYQQTCEKNRQNIMKRWSKKNKDTTVDLVIPNKNKDKDKDKDWEVVGRINSSSSSSTVSDIANGNEEEDEEDNFSIMIKEKFLSWWRAHCPSARHIAAFSEFFLRCSLTPSPSPKGEGSYEVQSRAQSATHVQCIVDRDLTPSWHVSKAMRSEK